MLGARQAGLARLQSVTLPFLTAITVLVPATAGVPRSELEMLQQQTAAARLAAGGEGAGPAAAAPAAATAGGAEGVAAGRGSKEEGVSVGEVDALMSPSEPVSAESMEDLQLQGGVLQVGGGRRGRGRAAVSASQCRLPLLPANVSWGHCHALVL